MAAIKITNKKGRVIIDLQASYFESLVAECHESLEQKCKSAKTLKAAAEDLPVITIMAGIGRAFIDNTKDAPEGSKFTLSL